jgi:pantothenate kinase
MTELTRVVPEYGVRQVYNGTGGTLLQGSLVKLKAAATYKNEIEAAAGASDAVLGVLMADVANLKYGDCQVQGRALVLSVGVIAVGARVKPAAAGTVDVAAATNTCVGIAVTIGAAGELMEVELTGPGGAAMPT